MSKSIQIRVPDIVFPELKEIKGKQPWLALLLDGMKYRGHELNIQIKQVGFQYGYDTHSYCPYCEKWILIENVVEGIGRSRARCPDCFRRVRTRRQSPLLTAEVEK